MKFKFKSVFSIVTLGVSVIGIFLILKKPAPVAQPQTPAAIKANAQSFEQKMEALERVPQSVSPQDAVMQPAADSVSASQKAELHLTADEVDAALAQSLKAASSNKPALDTDVGTDGPVIKDQEVGFEGDVVHGQFLAQIAGKDVWVTISGHLGSKDGYATFNPTEFKVGEMNIPVSLVNPSLQKRLAEQHEQLKLPDYVGDLRVQDGELILRQK